MAPPAGASDRTSIVADVTQTADPIVEDAEERRREVDEHRLRRIRELDAANKWLHAEVRRVYRLLAMALRIASADGRDCDPAALLEVCAALTGDDLARAPQVAEAENARAAADAAVLGQPEDEPENLNATIIDGAVRPAASAAAAAALWRDLVVRGVTAEEAQAWRTAHRWWPHLEWSPPVLALLDTLPAWARAGQFYDSQIVCHLPGAGSQMESYFHCDVAPAWANGRPIAHVVGVPLTPQRLAVRNENGVHYVPLDPALGTAIVMNADCEHAAVPNETAAPRLACYFRFLAYE